MRNERVVARTLLTGVLLLAFTAAGAGAASVVPFHSDDAELLDRWREAHGLELAGHHADAARAYERLAESLPGEAGLCWRIARVHYLAAKDLPLRDKPGRKELFGQTERWAARGIEADPECAECHLYRFIGLSRLATTQGLLSSARKAKEMEGLLDRAFELGPKHVDSEWNSEAANLHYAAGVFYRSVPDSAVMSWTIGVRGDLDRSIEHLRRANAITDVRIDYHIEFGAALLCAAARREDPALGAEGRAILREIPSLPTHQASDAVDRRHGERLLADPEAACDYSREKWVEDDVARGSEVAEKQ